MPTQRCNARATTCVWLLLDHPLTGRLHFFVPMEPSSVRLSSLVTGGQYSTLIESDYPIFYISQCSHNVANFTKDSQLVFKKNSQRCIIFVSLSYLEVFWILHFFHTTILLFYFSNPQSLAPPMRYNGSKVDQVISNRQPCVQIPPVLVLKDHPLSASVYPNTHGNK